MSAALFEIYHSDYFELIQSRQFLLLSSDQVGLTEAAYLDLSIMIQYQVSFIDGALGMCQSTPRESYGKLNWTAHSHIYFQLLVEDIVLFITPWDY